MGKISYPGEEQALHACVNLERIHKNKGLKPTGGRGAHACSPRAWGRTTRASSWPQMKQGLGLHGELVDPSSLAEGGDRNQQDRRVQEWIDGHFDLALCAPHARALVG